MKKTIKIVFYTILSLIVLTAILGGWAYIKLNPVRENAKQYVMITVPELFKDWSVDELTSRADAQFLEAAKHQDLNQFMTSLKGELGEFKEIQDVDCSARSGYYNNEAQTLAVCGGNGIFANDHATVSLSLTSHAEGWKILGFNVNRQFIKK